MTAAYFSALSAALNAAQCDVPVLVLDRDRLDHNLAVLSRQGLSGLRVVVKSLPSLSLLDYCMAALGTRRLMSFHRPFLQQLLARYDDVDILLGKPLPAAAVRRVLAETPRDRVQQVQWLVDTEARLAQLLALAREFNLRLRVNVEINVGLQRGGVDSPAALSRLEAAVLAAPDELQLSGLMGYDAHAAKAPRPLASVGAAIARSQQRYRDFLGALRSDSGGLTLNGAGSPTHRRHTANSPLNDISLGSVLVKPADFDLDDLADYEPALWIATPVLKRRRGVRIPFLGALGSLPGRARDSLFIYGGRWMAVPAWPRGMRESKLYGLSSNQQLMTVPADCEIAVDDWAFLRPTQSEAVMLQFGDLRVFSAGAVVDRWAPLVNDQDG